MSRPLAASRLARLSDALARAAARIVVLRQDPHTAVHGVARRILRLMDVSVKMTGKVPPSGLIVCNHLSYLDVVVLSAMAPCVFVAKSDVRRWPAFGWFAKRIGCIFAERDHPASAGRSVGAIQRALDAGHRVVLFPEGTSSDGSAVLPFRSSLLEPAVGRPISVAALSYQLDPGDGDPAVDVCYWRDMTFLPHLVRLLGKGRIHA
ncbi:MAG TPA: lysophospholipid acyltransferase family protein, partial [Opitutaceae bacterium]|nr:lysophospholipid acyltransferase family protein [Opitutaceae bacterium]